MGKALTVSSYPPISASTSVNVVSPRGVINKITRRTMYEIVVPTEMRLRFGPYGGGIGPGPGQTRGLGVGRNALDSKLGAVMTRTGKAPRVSTYAACVVPRLR